MKAANDILALARLWQEFLTVQQQVFLRLKKAFEHGPSKAWSDTVTHEHRSDDTLQYAMHARNADEHGIDNVTEILPSHLSIRPKQGDTITFKHFIARSNGNSAQVTMDNEAAANVIITFKPASIKLARVLDRGIYYDPPTVHFGQQIEATPILVAELIVSYLSDKVADTGGKFGHHRL